MLYISSIFNCSSGGFEIAQYDLTSANIPASRYLVHSGSGLPLGALQLARNEKIYVAFGFVNTIACINNPDAAGAACNFNPTQSSLSSATSGIGLPNAVSGFTRTMLGRDTAFCSPFSYTV
jgi:hypothetical protein